MVEKINEKLVTSNAKKIAENIIKNSKNQESYGTGLLFEHYIVGSLKNLEISQLESLRFIITKMIREKTRKKEMIKATKVKK